MQAMRIVNTREDAMVGGYSQVLRRFLSQSPNDSSLSLPTVRLQSRLSLISAILRISWDRDFSAGSCFPRPDHSIVFRALHHGLDTFKKDHEVLF